jgi:hypothetical protein
MDATLGDDSTPLPNWREELDDDNNDDVDAQTISDAIAMLGFDPFEPDEGESPPSKIKPSPFRKKM